MFLRAVEWRAQSLKSNEALKKASIQNGITQMSFFVTILQSRGPIFQLLLIYLIICTIPLGVGCYLLVAPLRGGNFLNGAFAVFPPVGPKDALKKLFYRAMGVGLILVSAFYIHQVQLNILGPVVHFIRVGR